MHLINLPRKTMPRYYALWVSGMERTVAISRSRSFLFIYSETNEVWEGRRRLALEKMWGGQRWDGGIVNESRDNILNLWGCRVVGS